MCHVHACFGALALQPTFLEFLDLELLKGVRGGFADGTYGYMVPQNNRAWHCKVSRISLQDLSTVAVRDLTAYGYVVPYRNGTCHGKVARFSLQEFSTVAALDLTITNAALKGVRCETKI